MSHPIRRLFSGLVALVATLGVFGAQPAWAAVTKPLAMTSDLRVTAPGERIAVSGADPRLRGHRIVVQQLSGRTWRSVGSVRGSAAGHYRLFVRAARTVGTYELRSVDLQARAPRVIGTVRLRVVAPVVRVTAVTCTSAASACRASVVVRPVRQGRAVVIQQRTDRGWVALASARQDTWGHAAATVSLRPSAATWVRAVVPAASGVPGFASRPVKVRRPAALIATSGALPVALPQPSVSPSWSASPAAPTSPPPATAQADVPPTTAQEATTTAFPTPHPTSPAVVLDAAAAGIPGYSGATDPVLSGDGRFAAFTSWSGTAKQIFLTDLNAGTTRLVSATASGTPGNGTSMSPTISADGRHVAFTSAATDLLPAVRANGSGDIYEFDANTGALALISVTPTGSAGGNSGPQWNIGAPSLSADGDVVAFSSESETLEPGSLNGPGRDIFVRTVHTGTTRELRRTPGFTSAGSMVTVSLSGDGSLLVAQVDAAAFGLSGGLHIDAVLFDLASGHATLIPASPASAFERGFGYWGMNPRLSGDGRYVSLLGQKVQLNAQLSNGFTHAMVYDVERGVTRRVGLDDDGSFDAGNSIDANGDSVAFDTNAAVNDDDWSVAVGTISESAVSLLHVSPADVQPGVGTASISGDGLHVAYANRQGTAIVVSTR